MLKISRLLLSSICLLMLSVPCSADLVLSIDPSDIEFRGSGPHSVDVQIAFENSGLSTLSGFSIRFGSIENASLGTDFTGVNFVSATEGLVVGSGFGAFNFNPATNAAAASNFGVNADVGTAGPVTLFTLNMNLGNDAFYDIGVDFRSAERNGFVDISNEFFSSNSPTTDFTFRLTNAAVAVPEPSSMAIGLVGFTICFYQRRRKSKRHAKYNV